MNRSSLAILALAVVLAVPSAYAGWMSNGQSEPSATLDNPSFMWTDAPGQGHAPAHGAVYFNGFIRTYLLTNPNVGATGSSIDSYVYQPKAILGEWTDCNQDGYIGIAETAEEEYPSALLTADQAGSICPVNSPNNIGGWVTELRWIAPDVPTAYDSNGAPTQYVHNLNPRIIADASATVWADEGRPLVDDHSAGGTFCWANPTQGSLHSTGAFLDWTDCTDGYFISRTAGLPGANSGTGWSQSPANVGTFGDEGASHSAVTFSCGPTVWDQTGTADQLNSANDQLRDPNGPVGTGYAAPEDNTNFHDDGPHMVSNPGVNPTGATAPGTVNWTNDAALGDCNTHDDSGNDFYGAAGQGECQRCQNAVGRARNQPDYVYNFTAQTRGTGQKPVDNAVDPQHNMPSVQGYARLGTASRDTYAADVFVIPPRDSAALGRQEVKEAEAHYMTYFAHVSVGTTPGGTGTYAKWASACNLIGAGAGNQHGWNCDPSQWYTDPSGTPQALTHPVPLPGTTYQLMDVDCADGTIVAKVPVYAGAGATGDTCPQ